MSISYRGIRTDRQWRAATGLTKDQFQELSILFGQSYESCFEVSLNEQVEERSDAPKFKSYQDFLFFILYSLKSGLTYDLLGLSFDISTSEAFEKQASGVRLLQMTLQQNNHLPRREYESLAQIKAHLQDYDELLIDGSEQTRQRPLNQEDQQDDYSGKKKRTQ